MYNINLPMCLSISVLLFILTVTVYTVLDVLPTVYKITVITTSSKNCSVCLQSDLQCRLGSVVHYAFVNEENST